MKPILHAIFTVLAAIAFIFMGIAVAVNLGWISP